MARHKILRTYDAFRAEVRRGCYSPSVSDLIGELLTDSAKVLADCDRTEVVSKVGGKDYFAFQRQGRLSRAINQQLFCPDAGRWMQLRELMEGDALCRLGAHEITRTLYSIAISFCAAIDMIKDGDQKTPGTFFECFIAHFFTWRVGVQPTTSIQVLNVDDRKTFLPTDFVFNLGAGKQKFHLPIKTSTRERSVMLWAHQRLLDGVYGIERFMGTPVLLAETKMDKRSREVVEICLPDQWQVYQAYIAKLKRVYYLDLPSAYGKLNQEFPPLRVKEFGEFFFEWSELVPS